MIILLQTPHPWRGIRQRPHHLAVRLARAGHSVRWVEPRYLRWLAGRAGDFFRARNEEPEPNLEVRVVTLINGERLPTIRNQNKRALANALTYQLPGAGEIQAGKPALPIQAGKPALRILWLYNPHEVHLADLVPHDLLIYDIMDEYQGFPWSPPNIAVEEWELLHRADWVFAGTRALCDAKLPLAEGRIECILSGVETERFAHPLPHEKVEAEYRSMRKQSRKLIGYAGMIDQRVDQPLLAQAARRFPDWGFVLVGPAVVELAPLKDLSNVFLLGQRDYEELPAHYHAWDAAMLPFIENELTRHINPTKMLEYAAAGVPIMARALPDVKQYYAGGAWLYDSADEFMEHLEALDRAAPAEIQPKLDIARGWAAERSWDAIANRMMERIKPLLESRIDRKG